MKILVTGATGSRKVALVLPSVRLASRLKVAMPETR